jgi:hypothetical protein
MRGSCQCLLIMYHESTKRPSGSVYVRRRYCSQYQHSTYFCQTSDTEGTCVSMRQLSVTCTSNTSQGRQIGSKAQ